MHFFSLSGKMSGEHLSESDISYDESDNVRRPTSTLSQDYIVSYNGSMIYWWTIFTQGRESTL